MDLAHFQHALHDVELKLKRLKALYEQWFQGIERAEPSILRKEVDRALAQLHRERPRNTAARFRFAQLRARYTTYSTYWNRVAKRIEEGTLPRDIQRARQRRKGQGRADTSRPPQAPSQPPDTYELDESELEALDDDALRRSFAEHEVSDLLDRLDPRAPGPGTSTVGLPDGRTPPTWSGASNTSDAGGAPAAPTSRPAFGKVTTATFARPKFDRAGPKERATPRATWSKPPADRTAKPPAGAAGRRSAQPTPSAQRTDPKSIAARSPKKPQVRDDAAMKALYDQYVEARRRNHERVDNIRYDKLKASIEQMKAKLAQKHGRDDIAFEVVVHKGRVGLRPRVSKKPR